jgi:hypothetical protein
MQNAEGEDLVSAFKWFPQDEPAAIRLLRSSSCVCVFPFPKQLLEAQTNPYET